MDPDRRSLLFKLTEKANSFRKNPPFPTRFMRFVTSILRFSVDFFHKRLKISSRIRWLSFSVFFFYVLDIYVFRSTAVCLWLLQLANFLNLSNNYVFNAANVIYARIRHAIVFCSAFMINVIQCSGTVG